MKKDFISFPSGTDITVILNALNESVKIKAKALKIASQSSEAPSSR